MEIFIFHQSLLPQDLLTPFVLSFPIPKDVNFNHPIRFCDPHNRQHSIQSAYSLNWRFPIKNVFPIVLRCYMNAWLLAQHNTVRGKKCVWFWTPFYFKPHNAFSQGTPVYMFTILPYFSSHSQKKGQQEDDKTTNHVICLKCKENHSD